MTIFIDAQTRSDLTSYDGLVNVVTRWMNRGDLVDDAPDFIRLAEARLRRLMVMPEMETTLALTPGASVPIPDDFDSARLLYIPGSPRRVIDPVSPDEFYARPFDCAGQPMVYARVAGQFAFSPAPSTPHNAVLIYRASIPALSIATQSNWLLAKHPDIYLYATLVQAEFYGWNDDRLPLVKGALDEAIEEANQAGNRKRYSGGPLVARPSVREGVRGAYRQ